MKETWRIGFDIGGTFTDLAMIQEETGVMEIWKVPSTPKRPYEAGLAGLQSILYRAGVSPKDIQFLVHGSTVAINAILEHKGAKVGLITTEGFRDVLEIGRIIRGRAGDISGEALYDPQYEKSPTLVPRHLRLGVRERIGPWGDIVEPIDETNARETVRKLIEFGVEAVAVCLLHSYANPSHEKRLAELVLKEAPEIVTCLSSAILPQYREFERMSTTVLNAYVAPIVDRYLVGLERELRERGFEAEVHIMQGVGGVMSARAARERAVHTATSGPVGGVLWASFVGQHAGEPNVISMDMGGTSTDVSLIRDNKPSVARESFLGDYPAAIPLIDINCIGAGGGSIAWMDSGGMLRVGPQSAGADPGPACYAKGGTEATITDANLLLGRLNPENILGGEMHMDREASEAAIARLGEKLKLNPLDVAWGIIRVANANMLKAIRLVSIERGHDPRDFALVSFGGSGPLHAEALARALGIPRVLIPRHPGVSSALGMLTADIKRTYSQTYLSDIKKVDPSELMAIFQTMEKQATAWLARHHIPPSRMLLLREMDMRYIGQGHEITISVNGNTFDRKTIASIEANFHTTHQRTYTHSSPGELVEVVNTRLTAIGSIGYINLETRQTLDEGFEGALRGTRSVYFEETGGFVDCPIYEREALSAGAVLVGPAIVEQLDSTTVIAPGEKARVDRYSNLLMEV
jgi:N-methylhydantoinase A